jgi:predicted AlkP superfamily phosphohydrolase/phosphomutase
MPKSPSPSSRRLLLPVLILVLLAVGIVLFLQLRKGPRAHSHPPIVVIGIDGGEWSVIRALWAQGKLPNLRRLADRGVTATLRTAYNSSPVIWTTIATGLTPREHGITDFVVATPQGDVPVSSQLRRAPAIWNMLTSAGRRVSVLGWWASWPAETINGIVMSDRSLLDLDGRISPASYLPEFERLVERSRRQPEGFRVSAEPELRDRTVEETAVALAGKRYDLLLAYFRTVDIVSHNNWKFYEPEAFREIDPRELAEKRGEVQRIYEAVDRAIGRIVAAAPADADVLVLSDHGFHAARPEVVKILLDMDAVLARLGYLEREGTAIDFSRSLFYTFGTPSFRQVKLLRYSLAGREKNGKVRPAEREALRARLSADLGAVTYESGAPVFAVRDARPKEKREGADLVVVVLTEGATPGLRIGGQRFAGAIESISRISGTHTRNTHGIFLAAGPDIDRGAKLEGIRVHDITPTLLYALGLPVAEDFAGKPRMDLFTPELRAANPLRTIHSWGRRKPGAAKTSKEDEKLLEELRALGYLN